MNNLTDFNVLGVTRELRVQHYLLTGAIMKTVMPMLILLMFLLGCTTVYNHPTKSPQEFEKDRLECEHVAREILAARGIDDC